jgi:phosphohistidine phosphatase
MLVYLVRHGKAEKKSPTGRDEDRPLQPRGERQSKWLGDTLASKPQGHRPGVILTSPALRALQTAKVVAECLHMALRIEPKLQLGHPVEDVMELIREGKGSGQVLMLIGHNPQLEIMLPALVPGLTPEESEMRTGEAALLDLRGGQALAGAGVLLERLRLQE